MNIHDELMKVAQEMRNAVVDNEGLKSVSPSEQEAFVRRIEYIAKAAQGEVEPVAWRDPTNIDPGESITFVHSVHLRWPHIYTQALYAAPPSVSPVAQGEAEQIGEGSDTGWCTATLYRDIPPGTPVYLAPPADSVQTRHPTIEECEAAGRGPGLGNGEGGIPDTPDERARFEAYMRGHCWGVCMYDEERRCYEGTGIRMLYGIWRDRGSLSSPPADSAQVLVDALPKHVCGLHINHNDHKNVYESAEEWIVNNDWCSWRDAESKNRAISTDEIWTIQWFPDTPIGSYSLAAPTLAELLAWAAEDDARGTQHGQE